MKLRNIILCAALALMGLTSCVKDQFVGADGLVTFTASYSGSPIVKTTLEGLTPYWTPADKISVYDGKNNVFVNTLSAPAPSAQFKGKLEGKSRTRYLAAYPYSPDLTFSFLGMTVYSFVMPTEQSAVENSYDPAAGFAVSYSETTDLKFKNMNSLVKFTVVSDGVKSVTLTPNGDQFLSGKFNATYGDEPRVTVTKGEKSVTLVGDFKKGSTYYISTVPAVLANGLTVMINGTVKSLYVDFQVDLARNGLVNLGSLSINPGESQLPDTPADSEDGVIYLRPNSNWLEANARFAAYFFQDGKDEVWADLKADSEDGVFKCAVPEGYTNVIFCRMNPAVAENNWDNKWGQTSDLIVPVDDKVCYVLDAGSWDSGKWTTYPPVVTEPDPGTDPGEGGATTCRLTVRVNKTITWYDKYIYAWIDNSTLLCGNWPGTKMLWDKEDGNYYVYYHDFPGSLDGKKINYIISGDGQQTKDLSVTLDGAQTTVTVEASDKK